MTVAGMMLAVALSASGTFSVEQHGTLREALNTIAQKGGISLVITGDLSQPAEVVLKDVTADEAIDAVAAGYQLDVVKTGKVWVLKPRPVTPVAVAAVPPVPAFPAAPVVAAAPVLPAVPAAGADQSPEAIEARAEEARQRAETLRDRADETREQARDIANAKRDEARAVSEEAHARVDEARARLEHAKAGESHLVATGPLVVKRGTRVETAVSYGGGVTVEEGAVVDDDVVAFGGDVVLQKGAHVDGDAVAFGGQVRKEEGASVRGEVVSMGGQALGASVAQGAVKAAQEQKRESGGGPGGLAGFLLRFAVMFGLGFVFMMFAPQRVRLLEQEIARAPAVDGVAGFLGFLALLPATVLLALTLIGIPVVVLMWPLVALVSLFGLTAVANLIGARLPFFRGRRTQALVLAVGTFALMLTSLIPVLGPLVLTVAACISFGAVLRTRLGMRGGSLPTPDGIGTPTQPTA